jgi:hypothetical protein
LIESLPVFGRTEKCFDHFSIYKVAAERIQFRQPELIAGIVGIAPQVTDAPARRYEERSERATA